MKSKKGISLIVLIVTIIVIIILAAAVILTLNKNNPIDSSRIAQLVENRTNVDHAVSMYVGQKMAQTQGVYDTAQVITQSYNTSATAADKLTGTQLGTTTYYELANTESLLSVKLPTMSNAKWYIDTTSGLVYLAYDKKTDTDKYGNVPSWMYTADGTPDSSIAQFVRVVNGTTSLDVLANK